MTLPASTSLGLRTCMLVMSLLIAAHLPRSARADSSAVVAVWVTSSETVSGTGALHELLLDRLGSNGLFTVTETQRVRAAATFVGVNRAASFDAPQLAALGRSVGARWVLWVKVADRATEYKKGLTIPHLFVRRKVVLHLLVDARVVDALTGEVVGSHRWRLEQSGAGSYQVAEDVRQDPIYNNSADQLHRDARELEREAARGIAVWFKSLIPRITATANHPETRRPETGRGPFGQTAEPTRK